MAAGGWVGEVVIGWGLQMIAGRGWWGRRWLLDGVGATSRGLLGGVKWVKRVVYVGWDGKGRWGFAG